MRLELELPSAPIKPAKYAAAGIPEFWLVTERDGDLSDAEVSIFRLTPAGSCGLAERVGLGEMEELST